MVKGGRFWVFYIVAFFAISTERGYAAGPSSSSHGSSQAQDSDEKRSPPKLPVASCPNGKTPDVNCALGSGQYHYLRHLSQIKCSELFVPLRPSWVERAADTASKSFLQKNWWPICSHYNLEFARASSPGQNLSSLLKDQVSQWRNADSCAQGKKGMRGFWEYVEPTQKAYGIKVMSVAQRKVMMAEYENLRSRVSDLCCASSLQPQKCKQAMSQVKASLCKPQTNPNAPDPCIESSTHYSPDKSVAQDDLQYVWGLVTKGLKDAPISVGKIQLAPLLRSNGEPWDFSATITHELGHACSAVKRQIQVLHGSLAASLAAHEQLQGQLIHVWENPSDSSACRIDQNVDATYRALFASAGASMDTYNCLLGLAAKAKSTRFVNGKCEGGCPQEYLEESWANWISIRATPASDLGYSLYYTCMTGRDNNHPLAADAMACFLKTPSLRPFLERRIECQ